MQAVVSAAREAGAEEVFTSVWDAGWLSKIFAKVHVSNKGPFKSFIGTYKGLSMDIEF